MSNSAKKWGDTISKKGEISRVFCGNIDPATFECVDLENRFGKYGQINGIDINQNGFAFIQFEQAEDAQRAVIGENKKVLKNRTLEVKMFGKSKKKRDRSPMMQRGGGGGGKNFNNNKMQRVGGPNHHQGGGPGGRSGRFFNNNQRDSPILQQPPPQLNVNAAANNLIQHPHLQQQPSPSLLMNSAMYPMNTQMNNPIMNNQQSLGPPLQPPSSMMNNNQFTLGNPNQAPLGNELEIIVMNKAQLKYCEMLERRFRAETCLRFIDLVFPHSPEMVAITLKDLFEKKTLYAVIVDAINEQNSTFNLHILHSQTEFNNVTINQGIQLICQDFIKEIANPNSAYYREKQSSANTQSITVQAPPINSTPQTTNQQQQQQQQIQKAPVVRDYSSLYKSSASGGNQQIASSSSSINEQTQPNKLPNNIAYVLKSTLDDNSAEFLSISQIDSVIEFYSNEKERLLARSNNPLKQQQQQQTDHHHYSSTSINQLNHSSLNRDLIDGSRVQSNANVDSSQLNLDNEQIKKALNSLMNLGALNQSNDNQSTQHNLTNLNSTNDGGLNNYVSSSMNSYSNFSNNNNNSNLNNTNDRQQLLSHQISGVDQLTQNYMNNNSFSRQPLPQQQQQQQQQNYYGNKMPDQLGQQQPPMFRTTKMNDYNPQQVPPPVQQQFRGPRQSRFN